jgi:hypothetical protein
VNTVASRFTESDKLTLPFILLGGTAATLLSFYRCRQLISGRPLLTENGELDWAIGFAWTSTALLVLAGLSSLVLLTWFILSRNSRRSLFVLPAFFVICLISLLGLQFLNTPPPTLGSAASERGYVVGRFLGLIPWAVFAVLLLAAAGMLAPEQMTSPPDSPKLDE